MKRLLAVLAIVVIVAALGIAATALWVVSRLPPLEESRRSATELTRPVVLPAATEIVADLDHPPGNIAVSADGRIFITFHPAGSPPTKLAEIVGATPRPYPDDSYQLASSTPLAVRVDRQNRLWVLDYGNYGIFRPRLLAFDLASDEIRYEHEFTSDIAGFLSMLNDFQVGPVGRYVYIAETSPFLQRPAIVVHDTLTKTSRRVLEGHPSVKAENIVIRAPGREMVLFGRFPLLLGVDSIALDRTGEWLYYGPVNGERLYRIPAALLHDPERGDAELAAAVEDYGPKPISDGLSTDLRGNVYLTAPEHSAVMMLTPERELQTVVRDSPFRWPDGLSFGPSGWLYTTCSALHQFMLTSDPVSKHRPYWIIRFRPGPASIAGH